MIFATLINLLLLLSKLKLEVFLQRKSQFWTRNFGMHVLVLSPCFFTCSWEPCGILCIRS
ncbi:hypothetical protein HN51_067566 [Arachis hypogaea]